MGGRAAYSSAGRAANRGRAANPAPGGRAANRGPAAAACNRAALIAAARAVFTEQGISAPLAAIAKRAGVGQGSLYRHFPDRVALAAAVFEDNVADLERLAANPDTTLGELLARVTQHIVESTAFVELVHAKEADTRVSSLATRVETVLDRHLAAGQAAGTIPAGRTAPDLMLAVAMVAGAVPSNAPVAVRRRRAQRAWRLLGVNIDR